MAKQTVEPMGIVVDDAEPVLDLGPRVAAHLRDGNRTVARLASQGLSRVEIVVVRQAR